MPWKCSLCKRGGNEGSKCQFCGQIPSPGEVSSSGESKGEAQEETPPRFVFPNKVSDDRPEHKMFDTSCMVDALAIHSIRKLRFSQDKTSDIPAAKIRALQRNYVGDIEYGNGVIAEMVSFVDALTDQNTPSEQREVILEVVETLVGRVCSESGTDVLRVRCVKVLFELFCTLKLTPNPALKHLNPIVAGLMQILTYAQASESEEMKKCVLDFEERIKPRVMKDLTRALEDYEHKKSPAYLSRWMELVEKRIKMGRTDSQPVEEEILRLDTFLDLKLKWY